MKTLPKTLAVTGFAVSALLFAPAPASAQSKFACEPGETYIMNVMVSAHPYWVPVFEGFKQAATRDGLRGGLLGHARLRHHQADRLVRAGSGEEPEGHPAAPDAGRPVHRADQPRHRQRRLRSSPSRRTRPNSKRTSYITSDNLAEAKFAAEEIAKLLGGKGEYAVLENPGQSNHDLRVTAFIAYMEENFPEMKLVGRQASNQDSNKAYQAVQAMLQANPNLGALWIPEAGSAEGAVAAVLEAKADVVIMHADVTPTTLEHIKAGNIHMALNPNQGVQGYMGFLATFMAAHPDLIDPFNDYKRSGYNPMGIPFIDNGFAVITKDNADDFDLGVYMEGRG